MRQHRIGEYQPGGADRLGPRLVLQLPNPECRSDVIAYHNRLMALCGLTFQAFSRRLCSVAAKGARRKEDRAPARVKEEVAEEVVEAVAAAEVAEAEVPAAPAAKKPRGAGVDALGFGRC